MRTGRSDSPEKSGGIKLYRTALPFFLGLILGDFVTGAFWSLVGLGLGAEIYRTFPN